jgi:hypothetical protein
MDKDISYNDEKPTDWQRFVRIHRRRKNILIATLVYCFQNRLCPFSQLQVEGPDACDCYKSGRKPVDMY